MRTTVCTVRLTHPVMDQVVREAENRNSSFSEVIRQALAQYFARQSIEGSLLELEQRIGGRLESHERLLIENLSRISTAFRQPPELQ